MTEQARNMRFVIAGLMLGILMAAMDNTIVTTAMGTIVSRLGGMEEFVWVTSAYMVALVAGTPIFGKLSDMYGRKRFFVFGLIVFMLGSALCGTADSIVQLSIYRAIQGIGGGALMPIAFTIIFDLFPPEKRGKMTGLFGAVFGLSSVLGPLLGGYITDHLGWNWVFYINVPIGIVSLFFIVLFYKESLQHSRQRIDWVGAFTLVGAIVCLMFAFELGGQKYAWDSSVIIGLFAGFVVLLAVFLYVETKVSEPIISFAMFRQRLFATSVIASLFYGSTFIVATVYIPIFVQGVFGESASNSGLILMPMMLGVVAGSQVGGVLSTRTSYRNTMLLSAACFTIGILLLGTLSPDTSRAMVTVYMILSGFGVGFSFSVLNMSAIHHFDMRQRGAATSTTTFIRSLGMTLGISIYGIVQRNEFTNQITNAFQGQDQGAFAGQAATALTPETRAQIPAPVLEKITSALSTSISQMFLWALIPTALAFITVVMMPGDRIIIPSRKNVPQKSAN
ncbi:MDR family MFS transporter [Paenibacillus beijingensis]|uniref:Major facilitator transporter n=1 Tax=Paenibacillus beijingensis TaxID=1126833 RepID=A0A0D5NHH9_9BACL|nr:MDR family MFS transporter [Paenibacillus beijingensis]AJY74427.1 major facilitator transporter [Paenibacillus beijingensis]